MAKQIKVELRNLKAQFTSDYPEEELDRAYSYALPGGYWIMKHNPHRSDGRKHYLYRDKVAAGLFLATYKDVQEQHDVRFRVRDCTQPVARSKDTTKSDRKFQNECVQAMLKAKVGGLILNATGTGKTYTAALYLRKITEHAVFVVDELTLMHQAQEELQANLGEPVGIIGEGIWEPQRVTVSTIQSLQSYRSTKTYAKKKLYREWAHKVGVVIIDELHLQLNKRTSHNFAVISAIKPKLTFGLTATLQLKKKEKRYPAYATCGPVLYTYPYERGVKEGYLSKGMVVMAELAQDGSPQPGRGGAAYHRAYNTLVADSTQRNTHVCNIVRAAINHDHKVVLLCERPAHLRKLSRLLYDIPHRVAYGDIKTQDRRAACADFEAGRVRLLIANSVFKKGINLKTITFMVEASALRNPDDAVQKYGRGVRMVPGKRGLIYVDVKDVHTKHSKLWGWHHPFVEAAADRRKAYRDTGIPVLRAPERMDSKKLVLTAEKYLRTL